MITLCIYVFLVWIYYASDYEDACKEGKGKKVMLKEAIVKVWNMHWIIICFVGIIEILAYIIC